MFRYAHHGHCIRLMTPFAATSYRKKSFSFVAPRIFIRLPTDITASNSVIEFKSKLFRLDFFDLDRLYK